MVRGVDRAKLAIYNDCNRHRKRIVRSCTSDCRDVCHINATRKCIASAHHVCRGRISLICHVEHVICSQLQHRWVKLQELQELWIPYDPN